VRCQAEPEPIGGYTPADYISFSKDDDKQCHHNAEVLVDAPFDVCYSMWSDWTKLLDFLDLVGQVGMGALLGSSLQCSASPTINATICRQLKPSVMPAITASLCLYQHRSSAEKSNAVHAWRPG
jgi:hypothetical protein